MKEIALECSKCESNLKVQISDDIYKKSKAIFDAKTRERVIQNWLSAQGINCPNSQCDGGSYDFIVLWTWE
ncbi:MAG: hypothetical protein JSV97_01865 [candidate division WOR-3 bacterium]|nr:MAG: hypothetical protein JSV97_01865 [candidate division WOR-3 bacterium]